MTNILVSFDGLKDGNQAVGNNIFTVEKYPITSKDVLNISEELKKIFELDNTAVILNVIPLGDDND